MFETHLIIVDANQNPQGVNTKDEAVKMFSKVDLSTRIKLFDLFMIDFELFEYRAEEYLEQT